LISPIKKVTVVEQAIQKIYDLIKEQNLKENDRLPSERDLAQMLGISRPSLREAIRVLDMMGVIKVEQGNGIIIETSQLSESLIKPLSFALLLNKRVFLELFEARKIIEAECAELAASRATEKEIKEMSSIFKSLEENKYNREKSITYEIELHECIVDASKNLVLKKILTSIKDLLRGSRYMTVPSTGVSAETRKNHSRLIKAISERNSDEARKIMLEHLNSVSKRFKNKKSNFEK